MSFSVRLNFSELGLVIACVVCAVLALALRARSARSSRAPVDRSDRKTSTTTGSKQEREPGEWTPVDFDYPPVEPFTDDISTVKPIPYRPFRWGTYHVTMGIRNMAWDEWIELDQQFFDYHKIVQHRLETRGERAVQVLPAKPGVVAGGHAAAEEFVHELAEYLSRRYPAIYAVVRKVKSEKGISGWYGEGQIKTITVIPLQVTYDLDKEEPLKVASLLVQEDFAIMIEGMYIYSLRAQAPTWLLLQARTGDIIYKPERSAYQVWVFFPYQNYRVIV
ncbi:uncharacterized protein FIBRA_06148 [Fibroporia radiculosa]|uniref:Uncharacterized protein n=1 Tax=Fibroporia radiculosa TaxID=599839 RepID=J4HYN4_9APHY|nr:uncharacterized protein FIBRA_06148 [Fibroporia radiculosa]CCM03992.1 predicted protein [Fibroporia radiculosa]